MDDPQTSPDHSTAGELTYTPGQAAELLNVSPATLRRMAIDYEASFDSLPRNDRNERMWPASALEVVKAARTLKNTGRTGTHIEAFKLLKQGDTDLQEIVQHVDLPEPAELVIAKLQELLEERDEILLERLLERMDERLSEHLKALTPPSDTQSGKAEYVAEMEQIHTDEELEEERKRVKELNRRIEYLQRELERRSTGSEQASRPWWRRLFG